MIHGWEVWPRQVQNTNTHTPGGEEGRCGEGFKNKGITDPSSGIGWVAWTHCTLWAPISLSVSLGLGQMKAKGFSTSHSLGLSGSPPTSAFAGLLPPLFLFLVPDRPVCPTVKQ